ncbi:ubiquitin carboxyl-terminal hydrolase 36 [Chelonus insularis]|uniref:ubiquitin carboxyl-terminal hydrolase 36 n=1 Tax=Chelonus insularis TaxID=460826 RepID=UPI0015883C61|nr:ubiquitin carboxyl-terminal hydrolase 36 [Chelonus insularis]XP_034937423.1 ubiquitin carboxyl-terminal hydrolase 36 [Chelonus insularis]XP_034937424.1 ubiquitin carboxyl-terminal hydrolase 36 [Chelonus insularis]
MPAVSVCDPVAAALRHSLEVGQTKSSEDISIALTSGVSRILDTEIQYEEAEGYQSTVLDHLKAKYIVLSLPNSDQSENGKAKETGVCRKKLDNSKMTGPTLPEPKVTLYPAHKVTLGWKGTFPVGAGMFNVGNTCYLNSTLQALFHVPALVNWLLSDTHHNTKCEQNGGGECLTCAMAKTLQFSHEKSGNAIKPFYIYNKLKSICRTMVPGQQEDAHEFLRYLLEGMERAYLYRHKATKLDNYSKETTPINQIFGGYIRTEVKCLQCRHVSTTFQHFQDLLVDIRKAGSLDEALTAYFSREQLDNNDYKCEACKRRVPATKQFSLERPPKVLCVQLKRFSVLGSKISRHIGFKQNVDMGPYLWREPGESPRKLNYKLMSIVTHMGPSVNCGHYTAVAQVSSGQYYSFDDSCVRPINLSSVLSTNAYIMIFEMEPQSQNQLPSPQVTKLNGLTSVKTLSNGSLKPASPKPSTSGLLTSNGVCNGSSKNHDTDSTLIGPQLPRSKSPNSPQTAQKTSGFIGPQLPSKIMEKSQPRLVMHIKNSKVLSGNSLVPYEGSSDEEENSSNSKNNVNLNSSNSTKSTSTVPNGILKSSKESTETTKAPVVTKSEIKSVKPVNQIQTQKSPSPSLTQNGSSNSPSQKHQNGKSESSSKSDSKETNGKDKWYYPIKVKTSNSEDKVSTKATSSMNGWEVSKDVPSPTSAATPNGWSVTDNKEEKKFNHINSSSTPSAAAPRNFNGTNRSDTVSQLFKMSHRGYGTSSVTNWNGSRAHLDREVDDERRKERKRHFNPEDEEMDRGRIKKIKNHRNYGGRSNPGYNSFQEYQNGKSWSRSRGKHHRRYDNTSNGRSRHLNYKQYRYYNHRDDWYHR